MRILHFHRLSIILALALTAFTAIVPLAQAQPVVARVPIFTQQPPDLSIVSTARSADEHYITVQVLTSDPGDVTFQVVLNGQARTPADVMIARTGDLVTAMLGFFVDFGLSGANPYQVIAINATGTSRSALRTATVGSAHQAPVTTLNITAPSGQPIAYTVALRAVQFSPVTYQWLKDNSALPGATTTRYALPSATGQETGAYTLATTFDPGTSASRTSTNIFNLTVSRLGVPAITTPPRSQTVTAGAPATFVVASSATEALTYQWYKDFAPVAGATTANLTIAKASPADAGDYFVTVSNGVGVAASTSATLTFAEPPAFITQPSSQTSALGGLVTFTYAISGSEPLTYQWYRNGQLIPGAPGPLTLRVSAFDAGTYIVTVSNPYGSVTSVPVNLTVTDAGPAFETQPVTQTVRVGEPVIFTARAAGTPPLRYQWYHDAVPVPGATTTTLRLASVQPPDAGDYTLQAANDAGATLSLVGQVIISDPPRLINLSLLTPLAAGENFTLGFVVGGAHGTNNPPLLIRAAGPSLTAFGVPNPHADPMLEIFNAASVKIGENDNWGGAPLSAALHAAVGAFPFTDPASKDAALFATDFVRRSNSSVRISGVGTAAGTVLAELYETTTSTFATSNTSRLINVSVLKKLSGGLTTGFVVGGTGVETVLIRAVGPSLTSLFSIQDAATDPAIKLLGPGGVTLAANDNWLAADAAAMQAAGAFALTSGSLDAALVRTLPPGAYTIEVTARGERASGPVLIEVYELP